VGVVPPPVGAARLQEEASPRSEGPAGSAQLSAAVELLPHAPPDAAVAPASTSQPSLGVEEASPVASLSNPRSYPSVSGSFDLVLPLSPVPSGSILC